MGSLFSWIAESSAMDPIPMEDLIAMSVQYKEGRGKNYIIIRSVSGITSFLSSSTLIWMIARSHKGLSTTQHRILLGLSICDVVSSFAMSTFGFMAPSENNYFVWNARGNEATCDAQGFLLAFGIFGGLFYNSALNVYYLVAVKFGKSECYIRTKIEPFLHGVPIALALAFSIVGLAGKNFNYNGGGFCFSAVHYPLHCDGYDVGEIRDGFEIPCGRGFKGEKTFTLFVLVSAFIPLIIVISSLVMIYRTVKKQGNKLSRYGAGALTINSPQIEGRVSLWKRIKMTLSQSSASRSNPPQPAIRSNNMQSQSRAIMHKAFQYSFAWILSYGIYLIVLVFSGGSILGYYFSSIFGPLQGLFNLCIYMYPKVISARDRRRGQQKVSWCMAISEAFRSRGKERNRKNRPRNQRTTNLRGDRNALREEKSTPLQFCKSTSIKDEIVYRCEPHEEEEEEEEEKCEIQPLSNMVPARCNVLDLTYAPNQTPPITDAHPDINMEVKDIVEDVACETGDGGDGSEVDDDGKEEYLEEEDENSKDERVLDEDISTKEGNDMAATAIADERVEGNGDRKELDLEGLDLDDNSKDE